MPDVLLAYMPPRTLPQVEEFELHTKYEPEILG
jgi:hypothetical protein